MRNLIRKLTPSFILENFRRRKKDNRNKELEKAKAAGRIICKEDLIRDLRNAGIAEGDTVLVHSSLSKMGYVQDGPATVVNALLEAVGAKGHILMPNSPNAGLQLDYIKNNRIFDVVNSPSALGAITEYFRKLPEAKRSAHPTEPVSCVGPNADYFVSGHFNEPTPYTDKSPFYRVCEKEGKILYIGVSLDNAGTNLHTLEDAIADFKFPVYYKDFFDVEVVFPDGKRKTMKTKVHNPEQSKKRKCDELLPLFRKKGVLKDVRIGEAESLLFDAKAMFDVMLTEYKQHGVTMYTPQGDK